MPQLLRLQIIVKYTAIGQCQIRNEMMRGDHAAHRQIRDRRIDVRHKMKPAVP